MTLVTMRCFTEPQEEAGAAWFRGGSTELASECALGGSPTTLGRFALLHELAVVA